MNSKTVACRLLASVIAAQSWGCERSANDTAPASQGGMQAQPAEQIPDAAAPAAPAAQDDGLADASLVPGEATADELAGRGMPVPEGEGPEATPPGPPALPDNWTGVGVLAKPQGKLPRRAPKWARVAAEVIERDSQRFLVTTARAERIKNPALARSTAENRARAELARWMGDKRLEGSRIIDYWHDRRRTAIARAEIAIAGDVLAAAGSPTAHTTGAAAAPQQP